jgi:S1-C subfamily serine protease
VITKFHGERVHTADDLLQMLPDFSPDDLVTLEIQRGDEVVSVKIKLARRAKKER